MKDTVRLSRPATPTAKDTVRLPRPIKPSAKETVRLDRPAANRVPAEGVTLEDFLKQQKPHVEPPKQ